MSPKKSKTSAPGFSRREFLLTVGAAPTVSLMEGEASGLPRSVPGAEAGNASGKFTPIELSAYFNSSSREFGTREKVGLISGDSAKDSLIRVPAGKRDLQGIPFVLGPEDMQSKGWIVLSTKSGPAATARVEIPLGQKAHFLCLTSFCDFDENEDPEPGKDVFQKVGQHLGDVTLMYEDNGTRVLPIRRRFETNAVVEPWGHLCFAALPQGKLRALKLTDPLRSASGWGNLQTTIGGNNAGGPGLGTVSVCALENPEPDRSIRAVRMEAAGEDALVICGLTLYHRAGYPLRFEPRALYRITLPEAAAEDETRWQVDVDLGTIGRTFALPDFEPEAWLAAPAKGLGEHAVVSPGARYLYAEVIANVDATLTLSDSKTGKQYAFDLAKVVPGSEMEATAGGGSIEIIERGRRWVHCRVLDPESKQPTPVRLAFRSKEGRYIPPYGHRTEINDGWFQDYGADVKLMDTSFAYVDGTFQVELSPGEVYLEMTKGFEHQAVRQKIEIQPGQRELTLEIPRITNLRSKGWVTADTHTHFLSPTTALLEAQAEGLNLINLLAAQWGDLFTNVGDLSHGPVLSADRDSMVWVGTENRQHILGHIGLEGVQGKAVFPMSADGAGEAYLGDPTWTSMAEWADVCRQRQGLAVAVHFPYPTGEIAADIVLGKIDAVEIWPQDDPKMHHKVIEEFNTLRYLDWYHYLNCGYRLPAVAGTDKMGAYMAAGTNRVYAYLGQEEFNYPNFAKAVRAGNTFATSGPLLMFHADGRSPGAEITLGAGGGTIEVTADAQCFVPIHRLEVIFNGKVVAVKDEPAGAGAIHLTEKIKVPGPGWLAARCSSQSPRTTAWNFKIAAHTSPVYVQVLGRELFSPEAATYFLKIIDGAQMYVETLATRPDTETFGRVRKVYTDARAELHRRMHQHGIPH
ncbi:MAG: CehA/McbA family metallohydrolase [Terriglobia bacterium]|jgi:hypothetical protein